MHSRIAKIVSSLMALALCAGMMPASAFAATMDDVCNVSEETPLSMEGAAAESLDEDFSMSDEPADLEILDGAEQNEADGDEGAIALTASEPMTNEAVALADEPLSSAPADTVSLAPVQVTAKVTPDETWFSVFASGGYAQLASSVRFAVWSEAGGQDDLRWYTSTKRNGGWGNDIPVSLHKTAGRYQVHVYATQGDKQVFVGAATFMISAPTGTVSIAQTEDQKARGAFSVIVSGLPKSVTSVEAPTWSVAGGQDDLVWYPLVFWHGVWTRELPCTGSDRAPGSYIAHAYATSANGVRSFVGGAQANVSLAPVQVTAKVNPDETWFSVFASGGYAQLASSVRFAVWSEAGGQDDLRWYTSTKRNGGWGNDIPVSLHKTAGRYQVHVYATQAGQQIFVGGTTFTITAPTGTVEFVSSKTNEYTVKVSNVSSPSGVSSISAGAWALTGGQDDLAWHDGVKQVTRASDSWLITVSATHHKGQDGIYENHVYVTCGNGVRTMVGSCRTDSIKTAICPFVYGTAGSGKRTIGIKNPPSPARMSYAVWSNEGGQDDLVWYDLSYRGPDTWAVDIDCHKLKHAGTVTAHLYNPGGFVTALTFEVSEDDILPAAHRNMDALVSRLGSPTDWLLGVDTNNCFVGVYHAENGTWKNLYRLPCSPGSPSTPTVKGVFHVQSRGYSFGSGYTCYYWTQFYGNYLFHSVLYNQGTFDIQDGRLGEQLSHGCVRMGIWDAQWIYNNIPSGTTVYVY